MREYHSKLAEKRASPRAKSHRIFGQALTAGNLGALTASVSATTKKPNERSTISFGATANATFATNGSSPGCDTVNT